MSNQGGVAEVDLHLVETMDCAAENHPKFGADPLLLNLCAIAPLNPACVVCGQENPFGLHLEFQTDGDVSTAQWTASVGWESFKGVIHGGVICAVLDEAMSHAIIAAGYEALTAEMRVRFRRRSA